MSERLDPSISEMLSHASWVQDLARRLVHDPASADDLAQSTWVVALEHSREPRTNLRGWLAHTMKNLLRERARRESRRPSVERDAARGEELPSTESLVARADAQRALVEAVLALDEPHKTTLLLRYFEGLPPEAIAKREGVPVATVASRITRAHAKLRETLAARGGDRTWLPVVAAILLRPSPTAHPLSKAILMSTSAKILVPAAVVLLAAVWYVRAPAEESRSAPASASASPASNPGAPPRATDPGLRAPATTTPVQMDTQVAAVAAAPTGASVGRIHGHVLRLDGAPAAGRKIALGSPARNLRRELVADGQGSFAADDVAPGTWMLSSFPDSGELAALGEQDTSAAAGFGHVATRSVEVAAGADVEVVLGAPAANPIRVVGDVKVKGLRPDVDLMWIPPGADAFGRQKRAHADATGHYEVVLDDPGRYAVLVGGFSMQGLFDAVVDVPREPAIRRDFAIPAGAIRGRVVGPDGAPIAGASVSVTLVAGRTQSSFLMGRGRPAATDANGRFEIEGVRPATYALTASSPRGSTLAISEPAVILLHEDEVRDDVAVALRAGFVSRGRVVDAQGTATEASVFVFDERGEPLNAIDPVRSDSDGAFTLPALAPGHYGIVALRDDAASAVLELRIAPDVEAAALALTLGPAMLVRVEAASILDATISLRDERARDFAPLLDPFALLVDLHRAWDPDVHAFSVPAGNYSANAVGVAGRVAEARVSGLAGDVKSIALSR